MATQSPACGNLHGDFPQYSEKHPEVPIVVGVYAEGERRRELEELGYIVSREPTRAVACNIAGRLWAKLCGYAAGTDTENRVVVSGGFERSRSEETVGVGGYSGRGRNTGTSGTEAAKAVEALGKPRR